RTPHVGVIVLTVISAIVGAYGVLDVNKLTQVTLISNVGTFLLYGMTNIICVIAFAGVAKRGIFTTIIAPILGAILNIGLLIGVIYYAIVTGGASALNAAIAIIFSVAWLVIGFGYLYYRQLTQGIRILHPEDYKEKVASDISLSAAGGE
ncbi:MAG TPA: APC family permease, partial [Ktedonobacteraceae bacterium]